MARYRTGQTFVGRNLTTQQLLRIGVKAAEKRMHGKRPGPETFRAGERAAFEAMQIADPQAGTSTHERRGARYSHGVATLAKRATMLARRLLWAPQSHRPAWARRLDWARDPKGVLRPGDFATVHGQKVVIRQHFPKGSTSYLFPHYKVDFVGGDKNVAVATNYVMPYGGRRDPAKGRVPKSTYYRSGSSFERYKKPSAKVLAGLRVKEVVHERGRYWRVDFEDGMGVHVHESDTPGRFYAGAVHDRVRYYDEARPEPQETLAHAYQYKALTQIVPHQSAFHLMPRSSTLGRRSDLFADVHDELYPSGRVGHDPRRARARARLRRRSGR